jgi:hypothetical protein
LTGVQTKFPNSAIVGGVCAGVFSRDPRSGAVAYSEEGVVGMAMAGNVPLQVGGRIFASWSVACCTSCSSLNAFDEFALCSTYTLHNARNS